MELTGAELAMHTLTDLDCEKYRHPDTASARRRDTYADHGVPEAERIDLTDHLTRWLPYLHSVVEASRRLRGGEQWPGVVERCTRPDGVCEWNATHAAGADDRVSVTAR